jgi:hypothetical protein
MFPLSYYLYRMKLSIMSWYYLDEIHIRRVVYGSGILTGAYGLVTATYYGYQDTKNLDLLTNTMYTMSCGILGGVGGSLIGAGIGLFAYISWPVAIPLIILRAIDRGRFDFSIFLDK